jgi:hypothetical protein
MKKAILAALALTTIWLSGCYVLSVAPFYTEKDLAYDPALLGTWRDSKATNMVWAFEKEDTNAYKLLIKENDKPSLTRARLFKLEGHLFLDMMTPKVDGLDNDGKEMFPPPIPAHTLARVTFNAPEFRVALMNFEWFETYLTNHPAELRHYLWKDAGDKPFPIVTAETPELQKFVLQHWADTNAWGEELILKREDAK